jgi:predicted amidohydrolase YtcJ
MLEPLKADMVLLNGKVLTINADDTVAEAVAIKGNRIVKVGSNTDVEAMIDSNTHMVDVGGKTVLPGFIDAHTHMEMTAINRAFRVQIHAPPVQSIDDVLKRIKQKVQETPSDEWILARSCFHFDQKVVEKRYPTKAELDEVAPDHPVVLMSGAHISVLNSKALRMAGITKETPKRIKTTLGFGEVDKDPTGEPTGILRDALKALPLPKFTYNQTKGAIKQWMRSMFIMQGITSIHDMPNTAEGIRVYQELLANNELPLRIKISSTVSTLSPRPLRLRFEDA